LKTRDEFLRRLRDDSEFRRQFQSCPNGEALLEFVHRQGYDFTREQLPVDLEERRREMSPDELDRLAVSLWLGITPPAGRIFLRPSPPRGPGAISPGTKPDRAGDEED
jgi:predicted ribosomally synthesized peptide with nif11-like leader